MSKKDPDAEAEKPNRGGQRLSELFPDHGGRAKCAAEIDRKVSTVSRWIRCIRKPAAVERILLMKHYGIGVQWWDEPPRADDDVVPDAVPGPDRSSLTGTG